MLRSTALTTTALKWCTFSRASIFTASTAGRAIGSAALTRSLAMGQQPTFAQLHSRRAFHYTQTYFASDKELQEALEREIKEEQELEENNLGGRQPPSIPGFKIERGEEGGEFRLRKTHGQEKILVNVNINNSVAADEGDEEDEEQQQGEGHESVPVSLPNFQVEITKGSQRLVFYLKMVESTEGGYDYSVDEFMLAPATNSEKFEDVGDDVYSSSGEYIDPNIKELLYIRYLEDRGFTPQFCHDLVKFATHYEHQQYVQMLEKLKKFVG